jgi:hypothetical protein
MRILLFMAVILCSLLGIKDVSAQAGALTADGVYVPRMTTAKRDAISNPGNGQIIYNTDDNCFNVYQKSSWQKLCAFDMTFSEGWSQKSNVGGTSRIGAAGFSIGSKGYIGTGRNAGVSKNDFWEYDPTIDVWTQKADFGGGDRYSAIGFSIGSKGYIGTGNDVGISNDFWEYDPTTNAWTKKANFGGGLRAYAVGFSIGSKGYVGTGNDGSSSKNDFWEYNPANNTWTSKANFGGLSRGFAFGLSISNKGYIGSGRGGDTFYNDFWEYNPANNTWTNKANVAIGDRISAFAFSIGGKGYVGTGHNGSTAKNDFWEYDPGINTWTQKASFGGGIRSSAVGFSVDSKGYVGTGADNVEAKNDFWEYNANSPNITMQGNNFNGANQLIKLDESGNLNLNGSLNISGNINEENFIAASLQNNWINYTINPGYAAAGFHKDKKSIVCLKGLIRNGTATSNTVLFNLPAGYRPAERMIFAVMNGNTTSGRVDVLPGGAVLIMTGSNAFLSLDGITFRTN